jgi:hypothetical protein
VVLPFDRLFLSNIRRGPVVERLES